MQHLEILFHRSTDLFLRRLLPSAVLIAVLLAGCGGQSNVEEADRIMEKTGEIESSDTRDPNQSDLAYDAYEFEAETFDQVRIEIITEEFLPLLKLVEISSGAVIAEWDSEYSPSDALIYTIAGPGSYEARVYAMEDGTGEYTLTIIVTP